MKLNVHLTFNGNCRNAFEFYNEVLDGSNMVIIPYSDTPSVESVPVDWRNKVCHASLDLQGMSLAGADVGDFLPEGYVVPQGFYLLLDIEGKSNAESVFRKFSENGEVKMPLHETFWSPAFGVVIDQFGTPWEISCTDTIA